MKKIRLKHVPLVIPFFLTLLVTAPACSKLQNNAPEKIIARINGQALLIDDFLINLNQLKAQQDEISLKNPKLLQQIKTRALNELIVATLLKQEASKAQIKIAKEEIEGRLANWKEGYPVGGFEEMLKKQNITEEFLKRRIEQLLLIEKITTEFFASETLVSDEEIKNYHNSHQDEFSYPSRVHVYQIVVSTLEEAQKIRQQIVANKLTFESAARQFSLSPDASKGGDIGFFSKNEKIPAFDKAFNLPVGTVSQPIQSAYGNHLLKVVEKQLPKQMTFADAKQAIGEKLKKEKEVRIYKEWITNLLKEGKIVRNETLFNEVI